MKKLRVWSGEARKNLYYLVDDDVWDWAEKWHWYLKGGSPTRNVAKDDGRQTTVRLVREIFRRKNKSKRLPQSMQVTFVDLNPKNLCFANLLLVRKGRTRGIKPWLQHVKDKMGLPRE